LRRGGNVEKRGDILGSPSQFPCKSQGKITGKAFGSVPQKGISQSGNLEKVYLAKQGEVEIETGKRSTSCLTCKRVRSERPQNGVFCSGMCVPCELEDISMNPPQIHDHLATVSHFIKFMFLLLFQHGENGSQMDLVITQNMETRGLV
jgi:hypothetical protein